MTVLVREGRPARRLAPGRTGRLRACRTLLACAVCLAGTTLSADPVRVRFAEGLVHGFLALRTLDGTTIADGDLLQVAKGDRVTSRLVFHFKDGSLSDETAVYSQRGAFRFLSGHLVQKGPAFPKTLDLSIDGGGRVRVSSTDDEGKTKVKDERMRLPPDLANGMILTLLKNVRPEVPKTEVAFLAPGSTPRLVQLEISPAGEESFSIGGSARKAVHYVVKVDIPGVAGIIAPIIGKDPPDSHVWILQGEAPAFVKSEAPMFEGGPLWRIELVNPVWPR